jgi:hypothetical protein
MFAASAEVAFAHATVQLPVAPEDVLAAVRAVYAFDSVLEPDTTARWPRGCRSLADLGNLSDEVLGRYGVTTLAQRVRLRRAAAQAAPPPANGPEPVPPAHASAAVPVASADQLSDAPWLGSADIYAAWREARGGATSAPRFWGGGVVALTATFIVSTSSLGWWWCLAVPFVAGLLFWSARNKALPRALACLSGAMFAHFILGWVVTPGTPEGAFVSGAASIAAAVFTAPWVAAAQWPAALLGARRVKLVPTFQEVGASLGMPAVVDALRNLGLTEKDLPEASDRTLFNAGLVQPDSRAAFRAALLPRERTVAVPFWREFWQATAVIVLALVMTLMGTAGAWMDEQRAYDNQMLNEKRMQTMYLKQQADAATADSWICPGHDAITISNGCPKTTFWGSCACDRLTKHR